MERRVRLQRGRGTTGAGQRVAVGEPGRAGHRGRAPPQVGAVGFAALTDANGLDSAALRTLAERQGFLLLRRAVPDERLSPLRDLVARACRTRGWLRADHTTDPAVRLGAYDDPRWIELLSEVLPSAAFDAVRHTPAILECLQALWQDRPVPQAGDVCRLVSPGWPALTTPPHQDAAYLGGTPRAWAAWTPLWDCPLALGPLCLLPGSHTAGLWPHAPTAGVAADALQGIATSIDDRWAAADLAAGDVLLFSCWTVHAALPNQTPDRLRASVDFRYRPAGEVAAG
ncbi:MAG: hypothetical protein EXR79_16140 [Myxococcales bacterium]|nr:hypothetical protein [Myxococcales bacterium]